MRSIGRDGVLLGSPVLQNWLEAINGGDVSCGHLYVAMPNRDDDQMQML